MRMLIPDRHIQFSFGFLVLMTIQLASCGQQTAPVLSPETQAMGARSESETVTGKALMAARGSSDDPVSSAPQRVEIFSKAFEPLTLQRGSSVRVNISLSDKAVADGLVKSVEFESSHESLKGSLVQGRVLSLIVAEDASEGRYDGRVIVRLQNGRVASQLVPVTVIP